MPASDVDWVKFTLSANSEVRLETSGSSGDTQMWLYDSNLNQIEFDDDDGTGRFSLIDRSCNVDSLSAGTYYVKVDEYDNDDEINSYSIRLNVSECATSFAYFDDFSNPSSGWFDNGDSMGYRSGEYQVRVDVENAWTGVVNPYVGSMDYTLGADMRLYSGGPVRYGLIFDWQDWDHFYVFSVNPEAQNYSVLRRDGSNWVTIMGNTSSSHINSGNSTNHLEVTVLQNLFEVRVNGHNLGTFNGGAYASRFNREDGDLWVGLYAKSGTGIPVTARYDNFSIQEEQVHGAQRRSMPDKMRLLPNEAIHLQQE